MKNLLVYTIEWDNPHSNLDFGASLPRVMYFILNQDKENLTKEELCERVSKLWFGRHKPISLRFREAAEKELNENSVRNACPIIQELQE